MWGIEFERGADILASSIVFHTVITGGKKSDFTPETYKFNCGPHGNALYKRVGKDDWDRIPGDPEEVLLAVFEPIGHHWTIEGFWMAAFFFEEGRKKGNSEGEFRAREEMAARREAGTK